MQDFPILINADHIGPFLISVNIDPLPASGLIQINARRDCPRLEYFMFPIGSHPWLAMLQRIAVLCALQLVLSTSTFLVSFLGDLQWSAKAGVPVYRLAGGAGFLWAATFNQDGREVLRFLTIDASQIVPPDVAQNPQNIPSLLPQVRSPQRPSKEFAEVPLNGPQGLRVPERRPQAPGMFPSAPGAQAETSFAPAKGAESARTVNVTATGDTPEAARNEAARMAVQQIAGVFIDDRRRVEINMTGENVSQIIEEKLLSYTNAYVSALEVLSSDYKSGVYTITAKVTVAVAPLIKTLQANNVPIVKFDSSSAAATASTAAEEKKNALELYKDLLVRLDRLVTLGVGKPVASPSIPSASDSTWISVPIAFFMNNDAAKEWHDKFSLMADRRAQIELNVRNTRTTYGECALPNAMINMRIGYQMFFAERPGTDQTGVSACFVSAATPSGGMIADCFGRAFVAQTSPNSFGGNSALSVAERAKQVRMLVEFVDENGSTVHSTEIPFRNFPSVSTEYSRSAPDPGSTAFVNYCTETNHRIFFSVHAGNFRTMEFSFGETIIFPAPGSRVDAILNVLLPNDKISQIDKIRARIGK